MVARLTPLPDGLTGASPESVFGKVAELGSFRRAALVLGLPASVVTATVRALERRLGCALLVRAGASLALSPAGAAMLRSLPGGACTELVECTASPARSVLRVDVCSSQSRLLLGAMPHFAARHPQLSVCLYSTVHGFAATAPGIDAVLRLGGPGAAPDGAESLGTYRVVTCASPAYLADRGVPGSPAELRGHRSIPFLVEANGVARALRFHAADTMLEVELDHVVAACDVGTQLAAAAAGLGVAQVPLTREARALLTQRRLVPILEAYEPPGAPILMQHRSEVPPGFAAFRGWLADLYRSESLVLRPRR
jgi:LysR family transcriptional regulator for bpeEF and oprC